jgi:hypothetical protein
LIKNRENILPFIRLDDLEPALFRKNTEKLDKPRIMRGDQARLYHELG